MFSVDGKRRERVPYGVYPSRNSGTENTCAITRRLEDGRFDYPLSELLSMKCQILSWSPLDRWHGVFSGQSLEGIRELGIPENRPNALRRSPPEDDRIEQTGQSLPSRRFIPHQNATNAIREIHTEVVKRG